VSVVGARDGELLRLHGYSGRPQVRALGKAEADAARNDCRRKKSGYCFGCACADRVVVVVVVTGTRIAFHFRYFIRLSSSGGRARPSGCVALRAEQEKGFWADRVSFAGLIRPFSTCHFFPRPRFPWLEQYLGLWATCNAESDLGSTAGSNPIISVLCFIRFRTYKSMDDSSSIRDKTILYSLRLVKEGHSRSNFRKKNCSSEDLNSQPQHRAWRTEKLTSQRSEQ
jgi:hypothetical protein